jgi:hypothetical protein
MYKGGLIFYLNTMDGTGLIAATEDQNQGAKVKWGCVGTDIMNLNNNTEFLPNAETIEGARIGDGVTNTNAILDMTNGCNENDIAAKLCRDKGAEWFLPSLHEANLMYINLRHKGHFDYFYHWTSTEYNSQKAWVQTSNLNGINFHHNKDVNAYVRAVRAF